MKKTFGKGLLKNKKVVAGVAVAATVTSLTGVLAFANPKETAVEGRAIVSTEISNATADTLTILGYEPLNYTVAQSYILSRAMVSGFYVSEMQLHGTLEEHLINLDTACRIENVNPNIVLAQQLIETSTFMYKKKGVDEEGNTTIVHSVVPSEYFNFAGINATDVDPDPFKYESNFEGQLADVHLMKLYGSKNEPLVLPLADERFTVTRGRAETVAGLSNTWAMNPEYGDLIATVYNEIKNHEVNLDLLRDFSGYVYGGNVLGMSK